MPEARPNRNANALFALHIQTVLIVHSFHCAIVGPIERETKLIVSRLLQCHGCRLLRWKSHGTHIAFAFDAHPAARISTIINNVKTVSARRLRKLHPELRASPALWERLYYVASEGRPSISEAVQALQSEKARRASKPKRKRRTRAEMIAAGMRHVLELEP